MKKFITRLFALTAAAAMMLGTCGCKSNSSSKDEHAAVVSPDILDGVGDIAMEDLPYGATMVKLAKNDSDTPITIEYDKRFITEEEAKIVSRFFQAINTKDAELFKQTTYEPIANSLAGMAQKFSVEEYMEYVHDIVKSYTVDDFVIDYLYIKDMEEEHNSTYDDLIATMTPDAKIDSVRIITLDVYYSTENTDTGYLNKRTGQDIMYCLYIIDGKPYII